MNKEKILIAVLCTGVFILSFWLGTKIVQF